MKSPEIDLIREAGRKAGRSDRIRKVSREGVAPEHRHSEALAQYGRNGTGQIVTKAAARATATRAFQKTDRSYDSDFFAWTQETAQAIRQRRWARIDLEALAEEVEDMGKSERRAIVSQFCPLLIHMLKSKYQPERQTVSWNMTIKVQRNQLYRRLKSNPHFELVLRNSSQKRTRTRDS